jgi:hypothetical protein
MLHSFPVLQGMPVDPTCNLEKGYSRVYNAVAGTEIGHSGCSSETGISINITLLFGIGSYKFLSGIDS